MKALLVILTLAAILAALFSGGCSLIGVGSFLWNGPRGEYPGLQRFVALVSAGVGLMAAAVLAANVWVLRSLRGQPSRWRRLLAGVLAVMDVSSAVAALAWIVWADTWHWAEWPWSWGAKAAACLLAAKGVLIWRLVVRRPHGHVDAAASDTRPA